HHRLGRPPACLRRQAGVVRLQTSRETGMNEERLLQIIQVDHPGWSISRSSSGWVATRLTPATSRTRAHGAIDTVSSATLAGLARLLSQQLAIDQRHRT